MLIIMHNSYTTIVVEFTTCGLLAVVLILVGCVSDTCGLCCIAVAPTTCGLCCIAVYSCV